jgi:repressor LexA
LKLPLLGIIPAGPQELQSQLPLGELAIEGGLACAGLPSHAYALRVKGNSMVGAGIHDGDTVAVAQQPAKDGDIVVALIDGQSTLKRLVKKGERAYLRAENPACPNLIPAEELVIQGVVMGVHGPDVFPAQPRNVGAATPPPV